MQWFSKGIPGIWVRNSFEKPFIHKELLAKPFHFTKDLHQIPCKMQLLSKGIPGIWAGNSFEKPFVDKELLAKPFRFTRDLHQIPCKMQWFSKGIPRVSPANSYEKHCIYIELLAQPFQDAKSYRYLQLFFFFLSRSAAPLTFYRLHPRIGTHDNRVFPRES